MRKTVIFAGEAGQGIDRTAVLFGKIVASLGINCFIYRDYSSLIRGGHNFSTVTFSEDRAGSHDDEADALVAMNEQAYRIHEGSLKKGAPVFSFKRIEGVDTILPKGVVIKGNAANNILLGALLAFFGLPLSAGKNVFKKDFGDRAGEAISLLTQGYGDEKRPPRKNKKVSAMDLTDGSDAVARGAIDAGLDDAFYYPMTPATGVFSRLVPLGGRAIQMEDEIAAVNAALGASYAGKTAMTGSSGGGMALMGEAVSFAGMAELPIVFYMAQRLGPSTGVPTYTSQGDMKFVMNIGPGEFPRVVLVPGDVGESYEAAREAFYLARKYRMPVFILSDKHIAENYMSVAKDSFSSKIPKKNFLKKTAGKNYQSYAITNDGVSPGIAPGNGGVFRATSYEHDEYGYTTEDAGAVKKMNDKRLKKSDSLNRELKDIPGITVYGKGSRVLAFTGSPKGAVLDAAPKDWKMVQIKRLYPFPKAEFLRATVGKQVVTVENDATGLLADIIKESCGTEVRKKILKYDGRPFTAKEITDRMRKI